MNKVCEQEENTVHWIDSNVEYSHVDNKPVKPTDSSVHNKEPVAQVLPNHNIRTAHSQLQSLECIEQMPPQESISC